MLSSPSFHDLMVRQGDGLTVTLWWCEVSDVLSVFVADRRGEDFSVVVEDRSKALEVFNHPFAYSPTR
jgi:hypothetical protein